MLLKDFTSKGVLLKCELRANKLRVYHMVSQRVGSQSHWKSPVASQQACQLQANKPVFTVQLSDVNLEEAVYSLKTAALKIFSETSMVGFNTNKNVEWRLVNLLTYYFTTVVFLDMFSKFLE